MQRHRILTSTSGIVLAGTFPWANSPFERLAPRPLVPVAHRPLIGFALSWLQKAGITRVAVCGNRHSRALSSLFASGTANVSYHEDEMPRGAAGCVRDAAMTLDGDTFVVTDAAAIPGVPLLDLLDRHLESGAAATVAVFREPRGSGQAPLHVPAGVYVLSRQVVERIARHGFVDIKEHLIPRLALSGERVATFVVATPVPRVLNADTYLAVNDIVTHQTASGRALPPGYDLIGEALVHRDAMVAPDVTLAGPVIVAAGASIGSRAVLVGPTSIGVDATVGPGALVSRSAVWRRSHIGANAAVDRSIIGDDGVVGHDGRLYRAVVPGKYRRRRTTQVVAPVAAAAQLPRPAA